MIMSLTDQPQHTVSYTIINSKLKDPNRKIAVHASREEINQLIEEGYLIVKNLFSENHLAQMRTALDRISKEEMHVVSNCGKAQYIRYLMDKDPIFLDLYKLESTLSIAQAVLGPQVQFDQVDARYAFSKKAGQEVAWHIHLRVVPDPLPPFFCYPHAIHCLLYLDVVDERNGQFCLLPRSHKQIHLNFPVDDVTNKQNQLLLAFQPGDCLLMHGNLWHRTLPSRLDAGPRRVIIFGYMPSWMRGDELGGLRPLESPTERLRHNGDQRTRELLGEFYWG
jgi:ectoine hydroxylase-related dioxygenase (phytanoyl-CoA dioxygenase family)